MSANLEKKYNFNEPLKKVTWYLSFKGHKKVKKMTIKSLAVYLRFFNFELSLKIWWCRVREVFRTTYSFFMQCSDLTSWASALGNCIACKRFGPPTLLRSRDFEILYKFLARFHPSNKIFKKYKKNYFN